MKTIIQSWQIQRQQQTKVNRRKRQFTLYSLSVYGWALVRGIIVLGICFIILYPTLLKIFVSVMSESDLYDVTVKYIPKSPTFENIKKYGLL